MPELLKVIILGIVEGITEFLPISSTGHLIVVADLLNFQGSIGGTFEIFIQLGAILAVIWYFRQDLWSQVRTVTRDRTVQRFWLNLLIAFFPAAAIGFLWHDWIKEVLFSPVVVAIALIIGGIVLILIERRDHSGGTTSLDTISRRQALTIGVLQTLALIPGTSRSASSIIGGLLSGLNRTTATAFSFYLAIPTLGLATIFDLTTSLDQITRNDALNLLVGMVAAFISALFAIGWLLRYIANHTFTIFGVYRIVVGLVVLAWFFWQAA
jgi:undecaprenyl-diphosphatase